MIWESCYWKDALRRRAARLAKTISYNNWTEPSLASVEKMVMIGFYEIRKLIDSYKLSNATFEAQTKLKCYQILENKKVNKLNLVNFDELYDFKRPLYVQRNLRFICNQFIHSYLFIPDISRYGKLRGVLVNSDNERNKRLYYITMNRIIREFIKVSKDYPSCGTKTYDEHLEDYIYTAE